MSNGKNARQQPANSLTSSVQQQPVKPPRSKSRRRHFSYAKDSAIPQQRVEGAAALKGNRQVGDDVNRDSKGTVKQQQRAIFGCMAGIDELVEGSACGNHQAQGEGLVWIDGRMRTVIKSVTAEDDDDESKLLCCQADAMEAACDVECTYAVDFSPTADADPVVDQKKMVSSTREPNGRLKRSSSLPAPAAPRATSAKPTVRSKCASGAAEKPLRKYSYSKPALAQSMGGLLPRQRRRGHSGKPRRGVSVSSAHKILAGQLSASTHVGFPKK